MQMSKREMSLKNEEKLREKWQVNLVHFLKSLRQERGISQSGLGKILGCSDSSIALLESSKSDNRVISSLVMLHRLGSLESKNAMHMVKILLGDTEKENNFDQGILQSLSDVPFKVSYPFEKKLSELYTNDDNEKIIEVLSICTLLMSIDRETLVNLRSIIEKITGERK